MTVRKIFIMFCKNIESFVMKSINVRCRMDSCFVQGGIFPKSVSVTTRLLERWEYLKQIESREIDPGH